MSKNNSNNLLRFTIYLLVQVYFFRVQIVNNYSFNWNSMLIPTYLYIIYVIIKWIYDNIIIDNLPRTEEKDYMKDYDSTCKK